MKNNTDLDETPRNLLFSMNFNATRGAVRCLALRCGAGFGVTEALHCLLLKKSLMALKRTGFDGLRTFTNWPWVTFET